MRIIKDIVFKKIDEKDLLADICIPNTDRLNSEQTFPTILFIHGGAWHAGSKEMYQEWGPYLAENGFVTAAIDYRLSTSLS